jgi:hypothetical protein
METPTSMSICILSARIAAGAIVIALLSSPASAAVWAWGCVGKLGSDQVSYNRYSLIVEPAKSSRVKLRQLINNEAELQTEDGVRFESDDGNSGFEKTMGFKRTDAKQKLVLTELSSRQVSNRKGRAGPRDEITTLFKKNYRYALDGEAARTIAMDCIEYVLTTKGGRQ